MPCLPAVVETLRSTSSVSFFAAVLIDFSEVVVASAVPCAVVDAISVTAQNAERTVQKRASWMTALALARAVAVAAALHPYSDFYDSLITLGDSYLCLGLGLFCPPGACCCDHVVSHLR